MDDQKVPAYDPKNFTTTSYVRRVEKPWGYELHWVPEDAPYLGKIEHINEGARLSLQVHDKKQESWLIIKGRGAVIWEDNTGKLIETELQPGVGYTIQIGQKHRLKGLEGGCDIVEVSTPERGTTWRLEDDYSRPNETPEQRKKERGEG
jgi:mannose-6-phosphate isomerase-like protein (cupin superfamily)